MRRAREGPAMPLEVTVGSGELPLCVEAALLHCSAPGRVEVLVASADAGFCALRGRAAAIVAPLMSGGGGSSSKEGVWIFQVEVSNIIKRCSNRRSSACLAAARERLEQGADLFSEALYLPALLKFAAARSLLHLVRQAPQADSELGMLAEKVGVQGLSSDSEGALGGHRARSADCSAESGGVLMAGAGVKSADHGAGQESSTWLSREVESMCGVGVGSSVQEDGAGGGRDWVDRSASTAGSKPYAARVSLKVSAYLLLSGLSCYCLTSGSPEKPLSSRAGLQQLESLRRARPPFSWALLVS